MIWFALHATWDFVKSSASVSTLIGCGAVAVAVLEPKFLDRVTDLRKWAICVAVAAFSYTAIAGKFYNDGISFARREWAASVNQEADNGEEARSDAVRIIGPVPADRRVFASDPFNRHRDSTKR